MLRSDLVLQLKGKTVMTYIVHFIKHFQLQLSETDVNNEIPNIKVYFGVWM